MDLLYTNNAHQGVYIHVPFCRRRCIYCDFYFTLERPNPLFTAGILQEYEYRQSELSTRAQTLYFGGGTPSLLPVPEIRELITKIGTQASEITLEANPEDLTESYLNELRAAGCNRLSLGVQSFEDSILKFLGRKHRSKQAYETILMAQKAGFEQISVDLIVGIEGENLEALPWLRDQGVGHLSVYLLTVEPFTPLARFIQQGRIKQLDEDSQADAYESMQERLSALGYRQYEVSNYALPGQESVHNRIYWSQGGYLGLGPGAHSMRLNKDGSVTRRQNLPLLPQWLKKPSLPPFEEERLEPPDALREALAFGIRDIGRGVSPNALAHRHQAELPPQFGSVAQQLQQKGWLIELENRLFLTVEGARFADAVSREFLNLES